MTEEPARAAERWAPGQVVDVAREMNRITMRIVARTLFGADMRDEADEVGAAVQAMIELFDSKLLPTAALTDRLPLPGTRRFEAAERTLDTVIRRMIDDRRASPGRHDDLLETLLTGRGRSGGGQLADRQVRDEVVTLFLAGHETTANWLAWTWYLLALHPRVEARLHHELDTVLDGRPPTADDRPALPFTGQVLAESLRLFPTVWMVGRRALEPTTIGGRGIPGRSIVMMSPWVVQRDPRWFGAPTRFDPDRWGPDAAAGRPRFAYFPFGGGARTCLGESFAWLEATLILAALAQRWRLRLLPGRRVVPLPRITLRPRDGVHVLLERRG